MEKYTSESSYSYILGISLTIEALQQVPSLLEKIYLSSAVNKNEQYDKLIALAWGHQIPLIEDEKTIRSLSVKENCYGIGVFKKFKRPLSTNKHIVLYDFNDFGELGTIMRSAAAFDFHDIVLIAPQVDYFDPRVIRASMGAIFHMNVAVYDSLKAYQQDYDLPLLPFVGDGKKELRELKPLSSYAILIPQKYHQLDGQFKDGLYLDHKGDEISLSALSSIVFNYFFHQSAGDRNSSDRV